MRRAVGAGHEPGVLEGQPAGDEAELAEPVELAGRLGGIQASGSKSSTWAATWLRNGDGSNRSMRLTGERPARSPARNAATPVPIAVMTPMPVIQIRRRAVMR